MTTKRKPGQFKATCRLGAYLPTDALTETERAWAAYEDARRREAGEYRDVFRWDRKLKAETVRIECNLDTEDPAEYLAHMERVHGRKPTLLPAPDQSTQQLSRRARGKWKGPVAAVEGTPFKPSTKAVAEAIEVCPSCGLVAEIRGIGLGRNADELGWREHLAFCTGTEAVA